jgi:selenide, water dikinase
LILTKGIGVGIYANALRKGELDNVGYAEMLASTTLLNRIGATMRTYSVVHDMTDVTGLGLLGHGQEMARASDVTLRISLKAVPLLSRAREFAEAGHVTGASHRNWDSYGAGVILPDGFPDPLRHLLTDAQTSGGLLISCAKEAAEGMVMIIREAGGSMASVIGNVTMGPPRIVVSESWQPGLLAHTRYRVAPDLEG